MTEPMIETHTQWRILLPTLAHLLLGPLLLTLSTPVSADPLRYEILPSATLSFSGEPTLGLSGSLELACPPAPAFGLACEFQTGEVSLDVVSLDLEAQDFSLSGRGEFAAVMHPTTGGGFSAGRQLTLYGVGSISLPPVQKEAVLLYGFDAEMIESSPDFDRYRFWSLSSSEATRSGMGISADSIVIEAVLWENIWEINSDAELGTTVTRSADLSMTLVQIPEPSTPILQAIAIGMLGIFRRARSPREPPGRSRTSSDRPVHVGQ